ncbi:MAG: GFA family protein [Alphaproteobacteria bacterium]|nr:GFA family protein [Alphaproteobacteria bacterium]
MMETLQATGGCHCGAVRFTVTIRERVVFDCNCSICRKKGFLHLIVPPEDFTLLAGADALVTYSFNTHVAKHTFCGVCGIHGFYTPRSHPDMVDVNVRCLEDVGVEDFEVRGFDGENWEASVGGIK